MFKLITHVRWLETDYALFPKSHKISIKSNLPDFTPLANFSYVNTSYSIHLNIQEPYVITSYHTNFIMILWGV